MFLSIVKVVIKQEHCDIVDFVLFVILGIDGDVIGPAGEKQGKEIVRVKLCIFE
jgi:hypothetical protein